MNSGPSSKVLVGMAANPLAASFAQSQAVKIITDASGLIQRRGREFSFSDLALLILFYIGGFPVLCRVASLRGPQCSRPDDILALRRDALIKPETSHFARASYR